jgi:hypothetical protein
VLISVTLLVASFISHERLAEPSVPDTGTVTMSAMGEDKE